MAEASPRPARIDPPLNSADYKTFNLRDGGQFNFNPLPHSVKLVGQCCLVVTQLLRHHIVVRSS